MLIYFPLEGAWSRNLLRTIRRSRSLSESLTRVQTTKLLFDGPLDYLPNVPQSRYGSSPSLRDRCVVRANALPLLSEQFYSLWVVGYSTDRSRSLRQDQL